MSDETRGIGRLFSISGKVWLYSGYADELRVREIAPGELLSACRGLVRIQISGNRSQAELLCQLYATECRKRLLICTPRLLAAMDSGLPPERARGLFLAVDSLPARAGGWRTVTETDYWTARMALALDASFGEWSSAVGYALRKHPAYPAAMFAAIGGGQLVAAARTIVTIGDPRWYADIERPERDSRLRSYLGLTPKNVRRVLLGKSAHSHGIERVADLLQAALGEEPPTQTTAAEVFRVISMQNPDPVKGAIKAAKLYLSLLRQTWLAKVAPHGNELFVPRYFFARTPLGEEAARMFERLYADYV